MRTASRRSRSACSTPTSTPRTSSSCASLLLAELPELSITLSHEIAREWREYERASTAVLNAYIAPRVERYLGTLERELAGLEISSPLHVMQSNGGITTARTRPGGADPDAALGAGGRDDGRRRARALDRPAQPPLHRHGRHVVRPQPRRRRAADGLDRDRARGPPGAHAARRHPHDRRRRGVARLARGRRAARRAAERRRRPRPGLLRARRHPADGDRREPVPRTARPELLPRRPHDASTMPRPSRRSRQSRPRSD